MTSDEWARKAVQLAVDVGASAIADRVEAFAARETYTRVVREALARTKPGRPIRVTGWPPKGSGRGGGDAVARSAAFVAGARGPERAASPGTCPSWSRRRRRGRPASISRIAWRRWWSHMTFLYTARVNGSALPSPTSPRGLPSRGAAANLPSRPDLRGRRDGGSAGQPAAAAYRLAGRHMIPCAVCATANRGAHP